MMTENRICPVCKSEIPKHNKFLCPKCHFELSRMEDDKYIDERKISFNRMKQNKRKGKIQIESASKVSNKPMAVLSIMVGLALISGSAFLLFWGFVDGMSTDAFVLALGSGTVGIILLVVGFRNLSK